MNLFDVTHGIALPGQNKPKPRAANENEIKAYLIWLADRRGIWLPHDADYQLAGVYSKSADGFVLEMPGYNQDQRVTMETLDEAGEVLTSQTLPVEPKKGGVIWDKAAVRKACGPIAKPAKAKRGKVADPIAVVVAAPVAVETQEASPPTLDKPEPAIAPTAAPAVDLDAITARLDALEAALSTLSAEKVQVEARPSQVGGELDQVATPTARAKRTAAHERAIRRAWQERAARRAARFMADLKRDQLDKANQSVTYWRDLAETWQATAATYQGHLSRDMDKRIASAQRARRMIAAARATHAESMNRMAAQARTAIDASQAELARLKRDMADPMQPERASDIARLVGERDTARTALAAMAARAERAEQTVDDMADRFEGLVSRVTRAEAALRQSQAA